MICASATGALAQGSLQIPMQFDFLNPGARSLAVGSAFAGLADDATAAFTNPAGLTILTLPEISFEGRGRLLESSFLKSGRLSGTATQIGFDTVSGAEYGQSDARSTGLSFLSMVYPHGKWSFAGYRHEFVRLDQEFEAFGVFQGAGIRETALRARRDVSITSYGIAAAYQLRPRIAVGAGIGVHEFELEARFDRYSFRDQTGAGLDFYAPPTFTPETLNAHAEQHSDTLGVGFNVGGLFTLYEPLDRTGPGPDQVRLGVVFRKGADFDFEAFEGSLTNPVQRNGTFRTPDALATGVSVRLTQKATAAAEVTWIQYEALADGYVSAQAGTLGKAPNFTITNGVEFHAGFEYLFFVRRAPTLRLGIWRDPDHAVHYTLPPNPDLLDERFAAYLPAPGAEMHYTFGGGVTLSRRLELNVGADLSDRTRQVSASAVVRFPRR